MANLNDKVVLDLTDDTELAGYLAAKDVGEECKMTVTGVLDDRTDDQAVFSVKEVSIHSKSEPDTPDEDAAPVLAVMMGNSAANKAKAESY
jgi:hypothetical protein|tara:strand:+ start:7859 stop:8131 length:273 start_codon:yes stop_codon:yes gene_type:complete